MLKIEVLQRIIGDGLIAVIRADDGDQALKAVAACQRGGVRVVEIAFTVPSAQGLIEELGSLYSPEQLLVGAGTVLDSETARIAVLAGARFVVGPSLNRGVARLSNRYGVPYIPGAGTAGEVVKAMEAGADIVKVFPGETLGPSFVKAILGPLPHASLMPTGGVSVDNVSDWIAAGAVAVGAGGALTSGAATGDFEAVTKLAEKFLHQISEARKHPIAQARTDAAQARTDQVAQARNK